MKFIFYHPVHFEDWDWRNSVEKGIGGSETSQVEMSWRLARRGHEVINYAPIPKDCPGQWRGTKWYRFEQADFSQEGIWILYRCPEVLDKFKDKKPNQQVWLMMQDEDYPSWTETRAKVVDKVLPLCDVHARSVVRKHPYLKNKMWVTSNGVKMELIREVEQEKVERNPKKIIYASSPDRGLKYVLESFKRIREFVPDAELHTFYGFNNMDKLINHDKKFAYFKKLKEEIEILAKQPNVFSHGRVSQVELYKHWLSAGIWLYQTNFTETSCITSMEAQALGAIPITNPLWALSENVMHGVFIEGDAWGDPLIKAKYVAETIRLLTNPQLQQEISKEMIPHARFRFNWERWVDQWEAWVYDWHKDRLWISQFNFQLKHAKGKILNVGCDIDPANFKALEATNVDINIMSPIVNQPTKADIIADARNLPQVLHDQFDTVILGDILEHMADEDVKKSLQSAKQCFSENGQIIITVPEDYRPKEEQHKFGTTVEQYADEISCYHEQPMTKERLFNLIQEAKLKVNNYQMIDYTQFLGHGVVCS